MRASAHTRDWKQFFPLSHHLNFRSNLHRVTGIRNFLFSCIPSLKLRELKEHLSLRTFASLITT
jgi:hypothetical protein